MSLNFIPKIRRDKAGRVTFSFYQSKRAQLKPLNTSYLTSIISGNFPQPLHCSIFFRHLAATSSKDLYICGVFSKGYAFGEDTNAFFKIC